MRTEPYIRTPQMTRLLEPQWAARLNLALGNLVETMPPLRLSDVQLKPEFAHIAVAPARHKVGPHLHAQLEIFRLEAGTLAYVIGGRKVHYKRGDIAIVPSPVIHEWQCSTTSEFFGVMVSVVPETSSDTNLGNQLIDAARRMHYRIRGNRELSNSFGALKREIAEGSTDNIVAAMAYLQLALMQIFRKLRISAQGVQILSRAATVFSPTAGGTPALPERQLVRALAYIRAHLSEPLPVQTVADSVQLSSRHLNRIFKRCGHGSINAAIENTRLDHAQWLLRHSEHSVKAIARLSGFCDSAYFCRVFKRKKEMSPTEARNRNTPPVRETRRVSRNK
jgi:AraC-like DNA-binding protein